MKHEERYEEAKETLELPQTEAEKRAEAKETLDTARAAMMDAVDGLRGLDDPTARQHAQELAGAVDIMGSWIGGLTLREEADARETEDRRMTDED